MSQQQGFGTGNGGGPGGDVKSICITENVLFSSSISLAAPICILPDADGAISFTADPPIILTAIPNGLNISFSGSTGGIGFLQGNDAINVGPDAMQIVKLIGNNTQGVSVTNTGPNELTITVADATSTQKGVVTLGESGAGITTINSILPDGANNFNITATVPYTVTPGTNSVNISDNGGVPYQFVPDTGNPVLVTGNSFTIKGDDPIVTKVFDFQPNNFYVTVKQADYGFYGVNRLAFGTDVLAGTGKQSVTCETLRNLTGPLTANTVLISTGPNTAITNSSLGTAGQTLFSNGGTSIPNFGSFTSTSGTITFNYNSGSNSLDVNANIPVDPLPLVQLSSSTPLSTNTCYMFIAGSDSYALPTTSAVNDLLELKVQGATSYTITQAAGQSIFLGNTNTTVGTGGFFTCNGPGDWIRLRCTVANTTWVEFGMSAQSFLVT
jgi:hypothetical protein